VASWPVVTGTLIARRSAMFIRPRMASLPETDLLNRLRRLSIVLVLVLVLDFNRARRTIVTDLAQKLRPVNPSHAGNNSFEHKHDWGPSKPPGKSSKTPVQRSCTVPINQTWRDPRPPAFGWVFEPRNACLAGRPDAIQSLMISKKTAVV
jgi:hypothetical protein